MGSESGVRNEDKKRGQGSKEERVPHKSVAIGAWDWSVEKELACLVLSAALLLRSIDSVLFRNLAVSRGLRCANVDLNSLHQNCKQT